MPRGVLSEDGNELIVDLPSSAEEHSDRRKYFRGMAFGRRIESDSATSSSGDDLASRTLDGRAWDTHSIVCSFAARLQDLRLVSIGLEYQQAAGDMPLRKAAYDEAMRRADPATGKPAPLRVPPVAAVGEPFPWAFVDMSGGLVSHDDPQIAGRIVIIDVWASWCGSCNHVVRPCVRELVAQYPDRLAVVSVNLGETSVEAAQRRRLEDTELLAKIDRTVPWFDVQILESAKDHVMLWEHARMGTMSYSLPDVMVVSPDGLLSAETFGHVERLREVIQDLIHAEPSVDGNR